MSNEDTQMFTTMDHVRSTSTSSPDVNEVGDPNFPLLGHERLKQLFSESASDKMAEPFLANDSSHQSEFHDTARQPQTNGKIHQSVLDGAVHQPKVNGNLEHPKENGLYHQNQFPQVMHSPATTAPDPRADSNHIVNGKPLSSCVKRKRSSEPAEGSPNKALFAPAHGSPSRAQDTPSIHRESSSLHSSRAHSLQSSPRIEYDALQKIERPRLTEDQKKHNHNVSETRRRETLKSTYLRLSHIVPSTSGRERSEAYMIEESLKYAAQITQRGKDLIRELRALGEDVTPEQKALFMHLDQASTTQPGEDDDRKHQTDWERICKDRPEPAERHQRCMDAKAGSEGQNVAQQSPYLRMTGSGDESSAGATFYVNGEGHSNGNARGVVQVDPTMWESTEMPQPYSHPSAVHNA